MDVTALDLTPTEQDLLENSRRRHGDPSTAGWGVRQRLRFGYFTPDEHYETMVDKLVAPGSTWLDVGCGRNMFPNNPGLARELAARCGRLVGVDPDATIEENPFVHERFRCPIEDLPPGRTFDLVTLRMVAEHIADPVAASRAIARLLRPGGRVVIYTIYRWAPVPIITKLVPFRFHHVAKKVLWRTDRKDTFPVVYKLNTRADLRRHLEAAGFRESYFRRLEDCRSFSRSRAMQWLELTCRRALNAVHLVYPETCILGVYERVEGAGS